MPEADLDHVRLNADTLHVRRHRTPEIVHNPRRHVVIPGLGQVSVQPRLCLAEPGNRCRPAITREQKGAGLPSGQSLDDRPRLAAERNDLRLACLVPGRPGSPGAPAPRPASPTELQPTRRGDHRLGGSGGNTGPMGSSSALPPPTLRQVPPSTTPDPEIAVCLDFSHRRKGCRGEGPLPPRTETSLGSTCALQQPPPVLRACGVQPCHRGATGPRTGMRTFSSSRTRSVRVIDTTGRVFQAPPTCSRSCFSAFEPARNSFRRKWSAT